MILTSVYLVYYKVHYMFISSAWGLALFVLNELGNAKACKQWSEQ